MRTIVDIPEPSLEWLASYCKREDISRAEAVRRALVEFRREQEQKIDKEAAFLKVLEETRGAWKDDPYWKNKDSVEYVRELRDEWEDPWEQP